MDSVHPDEDVDDDVESGNEEDQDEEEEDQDENEEEDEGDENDDGDENGEDDEKTIWEMYYDDIPRLKTLPEQRKFVEGRYINDFNYYNQFRRDPIHKKIMATKRKFLDDADEDEELGDYEALKLAIAKRQHLIQEASNLESEEEAEDEEEDEEEEETNGA